jgi:hypothetical protein
VPPVRSFPFQALMWAEIALGALIAVGGEISVAASRPRRRAS